MCVCVCERVFEQLKVEHLNLQFAKLPVNCALNYSKNGQKYEWARHICIQIYSNVNTYVHIFSYSSPAYAFVSYIVGGTCHRIHLHTLQAAVMLPQKGAKLLQQTTLQVAIGRPSTTMSSVMPPLLRLQLRKCRNAHTHTHT